MTEFGGRAMCPADEYADLEVREEMAWHALEVALMDLYGGTEPLPHLVHILRRLTYGAPIWIPEVDEVCTVDLGTDGLLTMRATSDEHLLDGGGTGTVDLTATLTRA